MKEEEKPKKKNTPKKFCPPPEKNIARKRRVQGELFFSALGSFSPGEGKEGGGEGKGGRSSARVSLGFFFLSFPRIRSMCKKIINKKGGKKKTHQQQQEVRYKEQRGGEAEDTGGARAARI